ncbi:MAG: response regulator, partial [Chloroflexi bacterium]|nr:response regulator [Chloroflexota bacterium]
MRVLLVEDERDLANAIARGLRRDGLAVDVAFDGASALEKATVHPYDVVVLDRGRAPRPRAEVWPRR